MGGGGGVPPRVGDVCGVGGLWGDSKSPVGIFPTRVA